MKVELPPSPPSIMLNLEDRYTEDLSKNHGHCRSMASANNALHGSQAVRDGIPLAPLIAKLRDPENPTIPKDLHQKLQLEEPKTPPSPPNVPSTSDDTIKFLKEWLVILIAFSGSASTGLVVYLLSHGKSANSTAIHEKILVSCSVVLMVLVFHLSFFVWILASYHQGRFFKALVLCAAFATVLVSVAMILVIDAACF